MSSQKLFYWNVAVACVHLSSFVALTIISFVNLDKARYVALGATGSYPIFATLLPFPLITGVFHIATAANVDSYYHSVLVLGVNRLRWIEYGITNGLMTWSVLAIAGAGAASVYLPVMGVLANFSMQYHGYLFEQFRAKNGTVLWMGFLPWIVIWVPTLGYYFARISTALLYDGFAILGTFAFSIAFVVPLWYRQAKGDTATELYNVELAYIWLSLTAKLWLDWTMTIGNLATQM